MAVLDYQPFRGLYVLVAILSVLARLPFYVVKYILPIGRQNRKWTYGQALKNTIAQYFIHHSSRIRTRTPLDFAAGPLKGRLVKVNPADASKYSGVLSIKSHIRPSPIPVVWYPDAPTPASANERIVLHIHGGAFVILDGRPADAGFAAKTLGDAFSTRVLMPSYRLASNPGGTFPAALQDTLSAYLYLLSSGYSAENVVISGDSAGGNIVLGFLRYLYSDEGKATGVKPPGAALLWSPWIDIAKARLTPGVISKHRNFSTDYVGPAFANWGATAIGTEEDVRSPYITSVGQPFACPQTKLWYQIGGCEVLFDECSRSAEEMKSVEGNTVEVWIEEDANHDIIFGGANSGFEKEAARSAKKANDFLR